MIQGIAVVVDDDAAIQEMLGRTIKELGLSPVLFFDGPSALRFMEHSSAPEIVICDLTMPEMSGFALIRHMRAHRHLQRVPIIVATARAEVRDAAVATQLGARLLIKPFRLRDVTSTVADLIEWSRPIPLAR